MPHYIHPDQDTFSIRPSKAKFKGCQLLIVVHSTLEAFHQRQSVRETWIQDFVKYRQTDKENKVQNVSVIFLVGNQNGFGNFTLKSRLLEESAKFDDILQADMVDHYNNLTLKSVFTLKFFLNTSNFDAVPPFYLMKVDNDVYLNVPQLLRLLEDKKLTRSPMFLVGHRYPTPKHPHTLKFNQFFISGLVPAKNHQHQYACQKVAIKSKAKLRVNGGYPSTSSMGPAPPS